MNEVDPKRQNDAADYSPDTKKKNRSGELALAIVILMLGLATLAGAF